MESVSSAALESWTFNGWSVPILIALAVIYLRGWLRGRQLLHDERDAARLASFLLGLAVIFLAADSPLDAFDSLFLSAHMLQHLLLMMIAPPLLLLANPLLPLLRGLPKQFVKEGLGPFLSWKPLQRFFARLTSPVVAWLVFAFSTVLWHLPFFYELALRSPDWHAAQHAFFLLTGILFWWPVVQPGPGKPRYPRWVAIPYLLFGDILNTAISVVFVFSNALIYPSYGAVRASSMSAHSDQTLAGLLMWVPGSIVYLVPAAALTMAVLSSDRLKREPMMERVKRKPKTASPWWWKQSPHLRRIAQVAMLLVAAAVMWDGFFGQQVAPLNMAGVLPWIHWRALSMLALLTVGNLFCMACPFMFVRDIGRKIFPANARWPRALRTKWLPVALIAFYFWAYEAFSLWDSPWLTACLIAGYFITALAVDGIFKGASFCKYVCPIGQFQFVTSLLSPREVAVRDAQVCKSCSSYDCIRGNEKARGCELYLFQPKKAGNLDCTFCLDCVKACPHDNVALLSVIPAKTLISDPYRSSIGRLSKRPDFVALVLLIVFGAFVNAAGMVAPVMMWEHRWHARLGPHAMPWVVAFAVFGGAIIAPVLCVGLCGLINRRPIEVVRRFAFTLAPIGIAMWAAHLLFHAAVSWGIMQVTPVQILLLNAGLLVTLYVGWRVAQQYSQGWSAGRLLAPWAGLAFCLYTAGVWILFQPMQMRGMMH